MSLDVILIEDNESDAKLILRELRRSGFAPRAQRVADRAAFREAVRRRKPDLVISDSSVPDLDCRTALIILGKLAPGVPLIVVSGTISGEAVVEALRSGAADVIAKDNLRRLGPAVERELAAREEAGGKAPRASLERGAPDRFADLSRRLLEMQEAERHRIARGLHDEFGQLLTLVKLNLESLRESRGQPRAKALDEALSLVDEALTLVRNLSLDLWPTMLDDLGLPAALRWLADRQARASGLDVHLNLDLVKRLPAAVEVACFRVVQEALTNAVRHAHAKRVDIVLRLSRGLVELTVRDDGSGFDPAEAEQRAAGASVGLLGMRERASLAGGSLEVESAKGRGTLIRARFPIG